MCFNFRKINHHLSCIFIVASLLGYLGNMIALIAVNIYVIFFEFGYVGIYSVFWSM